MAEIKETLAKKKKSNNSGSIPLSDVFFMTLRHWPWIILSVAICVGVAYLYLLRTPNVYSRATEILIKDEKAGQTTGADEFANLGLLQSNTNIQSEVTKLKAKDLMEAVVKRLGLDINYYKDGTFHDLVVYGSDLPVRVTLTDYPEESSLSMNLSVSKEGKVSIENLKGGSSEPIDKTFTGHLNDPIHTPLGNIIIVPTDSYAKGKSVSLIVKKIPLSAARNSYNGRLAVAVAKDKGNVLTLSISDQSTQRADDVLNTLIQIYNENWISDKNQVAVSTSNFINDRLGVIERELGSVDSDISSYKSANLVPDVDAAASMYMSQNQALQSEILQVNNQLSMARYIRSYLTAENNRDQLIPANTGLQSTTIQTLIAEFNDKMLQRKSLDATSSGRNPLVLQLDEQLNAQRQSIVRSIDNEIVSLNTQLRALQETESQTVSRIASNPRQAKNLLSTERQQKVKESLYLFLLQKREENELSQAFTAYNTQIVNRPDASGVPTTPNRTNILGMAFLIGLVISFGVTYVKETTNTKVRGRKDVEHLTVPFLGEIPECSQEKKNGKREIIVEPGNRDIVNEAFRVLRTNVEFMCNSIEGGKVIAFTSFNPGSGKSLISVNLAMAIALKGKRVLVIDGDMRHGSASSYVGSPEKGMADYLAGSNSELSSLLVRYEDNENLYFLPVGSTPPNPAELLETPKFEYMISVLKDQFDYVIIDCPPIEVVADAQIIDQYADRTFFIIRAGLVERSMLDDLERLYDEKKYHNMAFILNGTFPGKYGHNHTYRYGYAYGYGYGYDYGTKGSKK